MEIQTGQIDAVEIEQNIATIEAHCKAIDQQISHCQRRKNKLEDLRRSLEVLRKSLRNAKES